MGWLKKVWHFIWEDNSIWSWLVNVLLAFILIKFVVYPLLGLVFGTPYPIVAVVSGSMEHDSSFDAWWDSHKAFYDQIGITKAEFRTYPYVNGFNKGDLMILYKADPGKLKKGDVLVFQSGRPDPIIHRIVKISEDASGKTLWQTKGDHNYVSISTPILDETRITEDRLLGKAIFRVPYLGWVKIGFVTAVQCVLSPSTCGQA